MAKTMTLPPASKETPDADSLRVSARGLLKRYTGTRGEVTALDGVDLDLPPGEMAVLLGPSGCGKTTLLRSIAGLERPESGEIRINNQVVYSATGNVWRSPEKRRLSMVFQSYALWPNMTVSEIVAFPLRARRIDKSQIDARVRKVLEAVGLDSHTSRYPSQLSGGQQQRVALARAIVAEVDLILFDEPLSNVDARVREQVRKEIIDLQAQFGFSGLYVTHDQVEAGAMADRLVVMDRGVIAQTGRPQELYDTPISRYVANFMGTVTELPGRVLAIDSDRAVMETPIGQVRGTQLPHAVVPDSAAVAVFRPETAELSHQEPASTVNCWSAYIIHAMFMGSFVELSIEIIGEAGNRVSATVSVPRGSGFREHQDIWIHLPVEAVRILPE